MQTLAATSGSQHSPPRPLKSTLLRPHSPIHRRRRAVALWAVPLSLLLLLVLSQHSAALKCYICNNCMKYELSQSRPCPPEQTKCMKMNMESGQIQRSCGTETMCTDSDTQLKTRYTAVNCCDEDNCNGGPQTLAPHTPLLAGLLLLLLLHLRTRGWGVH